MALLRGIRFAHLHHILIVLCTVVWTSSGGSPLALSWLDSKLFCLVVLVMASLMYVNTPSLASTGEQLYQEYFLTIYVPY